MKDILPILPALIHVYIFVLESILWGRKRTNKAFGIRTEEDAAITKPLAFNQGFYNLFLAVAVFLGLHLRTSEMTYSAGTALVAYGLISIIAAGCVLFISQRRLWRAALIQIVPALIALIPICMS
jgi:putative membrane protein